MRTRCRVLLFTPDGWERTGSASLGKKERWSDGRGSKVEARLVFTGGRF